MDLDVLSKMRILEKIYRIIPQDEGENDPSAGQSRLLHANLLKVTDSDLGEYLDQYTDLSKDYIKDMFDDESLQ